MTKLGTAFVEVNADFSQFDRQVSRKLAGSFKGAGEQASKDFSDGFQKRSSGLLLPSKNAKINVEADTAKATAQLAAVEALKNRVSATKAEIKVDIDQSTFVRVKEGVSELLTAMGGSGGGGLGGATTRLSAGFVSFGSSVGPVVALLGTLAVAVGVSLVGAFAALASSMALAAAGAAAVGAALVAALGPVVVLGVAVASRVAKIFEALKAQDTAAADIGAKTAAGSAAAAAAGQQLASAERAQSEAARQLGISRANAYIEMADAAEKARDAVASVTTAQISLDRAKLSTERARLELEKFKQEAGATGNAFGAIFKKFTDVAVDTSGLKKAITAANAAQGGTLDKTQELDLRDKILQVREARDAEKHAVDGVHDAITAAARAQAEDNKFKREGIKASEGYRSALRGVETAALAVKAAQDAQGTSTAQQKAIDLTGKLSKKEQQLLVVIKKVRTELRGAFTPGTDAVFGGVIKAAGRLPALINPLRGNFKRLGDAIARSFDKVSKGLVTPDSISKLKAFTDAARDLTGPVTDGLSSLSDILTDIARSALPFLVSGTKKVAAQLKDWAKGTGNTKKLDKTIGSLVGHLKTWLRLGAAVGDVFLAFLESAAGPGQGLADSITALADRTAKWLRSTEGRKEMAQFFKDAIGFAKDFAKFMGVVVIATVKFGQIAARVFSSVTDRLGGPRNAAKALLFTLGTLGTLKLAAGTIRGLRELRDNINSARRAATLLHSKFFANTAEDAGAGLVGKAKVALASIGSALASTGRVVVAAGRRVAARLIAVFAAEGALAGTAAGNAAAGAEGLGAAGIKGKFRTVGRGLGVALGLGVTAGVLAGTAGLVAKVQQTITDALGLHGGVKAAQDEHNNNPVSKFTQKVSDAIGGLFGIHRASGGIIPGVGNADNVPIYATPGEFMTRKAIVQRFGPTVFADINAGRLDPTVGYGAGPRPAVTTRAVRGPRFATGGLVGAGAAGGSQTTIHAPVSITVPGGGPPDPVALGVQASRVIESRFGGDVRQD